MDTPHHSRRTDTRRRIQDVALELFAEQGYEKTSLREIAERLDVTKAALYYHFKTKEDILISITDDLTAPVDELIAWAEGQPRTLATKQEVLRRYSAALWGAADLFRFVQENQASVRDLAIGESFKSRMAAVNGLLREPDAPLKAQVRSLTALVSMHAGMFAMRNIEGDPEDKREAILEVALDLVAQAQAQSQAQDQSQVQAQPQGQMQPHGQAQGQAQTPVHPRAQAQVTAQARVTAPHGVPHS